MTAPRESFCSIAFIRNSHTDVYNKFVNKIYKCNHLYESSSAELSYGTVCFSDSFKIKVVFSLSVNLYFSHFSLGSEWVNWILGSVQGWTICFGL